MTDVNSEVLASLYTVEEAVEILKDQVDGHVTFESGSVSMPTIWETDAFSLDDSDVMPGMTLNVGGHENTLTKEAFVELCGKFGLPKRYSLMTPPQLLGTHLNYWLAESGQQMRLMTLQGQGIGFSKTPDSPVFSAADVLALAADALAQVSDSDVDDLLVDYKLTHTLKRTSFRLVDPAGPQKIFSVRDGVEKEDTWNYGLAVTHSVGGYSSTSIEGYLFAWWCTNGSITTHAASGKYDRRSKTGEWDDFVEWMDGLIEDIRYDMPAQIEAVKELPSINLKGEMSEAADAVFARYKVPTQARNDILTALIETDDWSAYGLMNAVTQCANPSGVPENVRELLFRAGGDMAFAFSDRCATCHRL